MSTVPIQSVEVSGVNDDGFKKVVSRKRNRNKKPTANGNLANGDKSNGNKILKEEETEQLADQSANGNLANGDKWKGAAEETEKPDWETSLAIAAAKIGPSDLTDFLERVPDPYPPNDWFRLGRFLDFYDSVLSGVPVPWLEMFKESDLSKLSDLLHVPLSYIPQDVYETSVDWLDKQHVSDASFIDYVSFTFNFILCDMFYKQGGEVTGFFIGTKPGDPCKAEAAIFVTLAIVVRIKPYVLTRLLPSLRIKPIYRGKAHIPITVWLIAQASQDNLPAGLYSWAHNLLPLIPSNNPQSRDLILNLVDKILEKPDALTILVDAPVWEGKPLIPPHSFGILLQLTFPATSARDEATSRFEAIYPLLKQVALAGRSGSEDLKQIFTISLKLAGKGNTVLAEEATAIAMWSLTENIDCWKHWENIYEKNLEASVALLKKLVDEWKDCTLGREAKIQQIFVFSLKLAREGNTALAKEAIAIAIWSLTENIDCWKHWENIYEKNLEASVALLKKLVWQCKYSTLGSEAMTQQIFAFSLKLAGEGNPVLPKKITAIAIWSLTIMVDCLKHRGIVYERKLIACVALLRKLVEKWKDHSLKLSSLPRDTLTGLPGSKAMKQITRNIFTFSLISAGEGNTVVSEVANAIAIWSLTENIDCWKHWENIYEKNLKASVALLKMLVDEWKDHPLKLSSSPSDTLTLSQTMKSFMLQNKIQKGANARLYKEADKYCKVILGRVSRGSSSLKVTTITAVVLLAAGALSALVISSNPVDYLEGLVFIMSSFLFFSFFIITMKLLGLLCLEFDNH